MPDDRADQILDAAEARIRDAGYHGFSFRDVAADVGIRSASVHHHFPTKEALAAAVAERYARRFFAAMDARLAAGDSAQAAYVALFREAFRADGRLCLCGMLGAEAPALPPAAKDRARAFFALSLERLTPSLGAERALGLIAACEGAMVVARALGDPAAFEQVVGRLAA